MSEPRYQRPGARSRFLAQLAELIAAVPGVETAAPAEQVPFLPSGFSFGPIETDGARLSGTPVTINRVTDRYFPAAEISIVRGRGFAAVAPGEDFAIISRDLADRLWPSGATVGQRLRLLAAFALLAVLLASAGLYSVVAYETSAPTQEIGVRVALGATRNTVVRHVLGRSLLHSAAGAAIGLLGALALTRLLAPLLYEIEPTNPPAFVAAAAFLLAVAVAGAWLPAQRAARTDPMEALRTE